MSSNGRVHQAPKDGSAAYTVQPATNPHSKRSQRVSDAPSSPFPPEARRLTPAQRHTMRPWHALTVNAFKAVLGVGFVLGCLFFLRPSVSQAENRELTQFPAFTWESFVDGSFTGDISTWYADTYPFRDQLMGANRTLQSLYGMEPSVQMTDAHRTADEIPPEGEAAAPADVAPKPAKLPEDYNPADLEADIQGEIMGGTYVKDGACYSKYYFTQRVAQAYADALNGAADRLGEEHSVYSILIPNNSGAMLSHDELEALGGSDQQQAIDYYYSLYRENVHSIPTCDTLREHNSEYLYFRTDHHWTALGAYYVYRNLAETKGWEAHALSQFQEVDFPNFLGTYYNSLQLASMAANPDTVQAWVPLGTNEMTYVDENGTVMDWPVIQDVSEWTTSSKYSCFVAGDQSWAEIHNPAITDGSSCVVVKESYGNALIPWLVDHYQDIYIADFRYVQRNVVDFMLENKVDDLIVINNIGIAGTDSATGKIASIL